MHEEVWFQSATSNISGFKTQGSVEDWRSNIAALCVGNSRLVLAISAAFAAPLIQLSNEESGGVHIKGTSSSGKTTTLKVANTVWGEPARIEQWRATSNGLEGVAAKHNDSLLCLDELSQIDPKEIGEVAYMLANGSGKSRSKKDGTLRKKTDWRLFFCSTGETGLAEHMLQTGKKTKAGQQVRILEVPADAGLNLGIFEDLHGFADGDKFARHLDQQTKLYYGTSSREFLREIITGNVEQLAKKLESLKQDFIKKLSIDNKADGQVKRAASRFALIAVAGELATSFGLTGWAEGEATNAVKKCFESWLEQRGGTTSYEEQQIITHVRDFFQRYSQSRFITWYASPSSSGCYDADLKINNKAGFVKKDDTGHITGFYVETEVFRNELCSGFNIRSVAKICIEQGWLLRDKKGNKSASVHTMPDTNKPRRMYLFNDQVLGGEYDK